MTDKKKTFEELVADLPEALGTSMLAVSEVPPQAPEDRATAERVVRKMHAEKFPEEYPVQERVLPKWPQMLVAGAPVTVEQAKEIIRRTDSFFIYGGGNDHEWIAAVRRALRMSPATEYWEGDVQVPSEVYQEREDKAWKYDERWREKWGLLVTEYVTNSWLSSSFIGGPHGWVHPDGKIGYTDNVGKWPSMAELVSDWKYIAESFPFLKLGVVFMSGESCDESRKPVFSIMVDEGTATLMDPYKVDVHEGFEVPQAPGIEESARSFFAKSPRHREHGLSPAWIEEWAVKAQALFDKDYRKTFGAP